MDFEIMDQKAVVLAKEFKRTEAELLEIIIKLDDYKVFRKMGYNSLYQYVVKRLGLSEGQAYGFINVARKSNEVPKLKESIKNGTLSVSKAKRITSVITKENQDHWLELAEKATQKKVEREVALMNPQKAIAEKATYVSSFEFIPEKVQVKRSTLQVKLEVGISEKTMLKIRRAQDIISQKKRSSVTLEKTLESLVDDYLKKHDPLEKAKRQKNKGKLIPKIEQSLRKEAAQEAQGLPIQKGAFGDLDTKRSCNKVRKRKPLSSALKHQVYLEAEGRCTSKDSDGTRCSSSRFLEIHHIRPLSKGGKDELENLVLLCSGHHATYHQDVP